MDFTYEKVTVEEARQALDHGPSVPQEDWKLHRLPPVPEALLDVAAKWLMELPEHARPIELMKRFPRIANKLYQLRSQPVQLEHYLVDLLIIRRGNSVRQGFPARVASEIAALGVLYATPVAKGPRATIG